MVLRLLRQHQHHAAVLTAQQLAIKEVSFNRVLYADRLGRHLNRHKSRHPLMQRSEQLLLMGKRLLMAEQHLAVRDGNDVIVENPLVNHLRVLLSKNHL